MSLSNIEFVVDRVITQFSNSLNDEKMNIDYDGISNTIKTYIKDHDWELNDIIQDLMNINGAFASKLRKYINDDSILSKLCNSLSNMLFQAKLQKNSISKIKRLKSKRNIRTDQSDILLKRFPKYICKAIWYTSSDEILETLIDEAVYTLYNNNEIWNDIDFIKDIYTPIDERYCTRCVQKIYEDMNTGEFFEKFVQIQFDREIKLYNWKGKSKGIKNNDNLYRRSSSTNDIECTYWFGYTSECIESNDKIDYDKFYYKISQNKSDINYVVNKVEVTKNSDFEWGYYNKFVRNKRGNYIKISLSKYNKCLKRYWEVMKPGFMDKYNDNTKKEMEYGLVSEKHLNIIYQLCQYYNRLKDSPYKNEINSDKTVLKLFYIGPYNLDTLLVKIKIEIDGIKYILKYWNARNNDSTNAFVITKIPDNRDYEEYFKNPIENEYNEDINSNYYVYFRTSWNALNKEPSWEYFDNSKFSKYDHIDVIKQLELTFQAYIYENFPNDEFPFNTDIKSKNIRMYSMLTELQEYLKSKNLPGKRIYLLNPIYKTYGSKQFIIALTQVAHVKLSGEREYSEYSRLVRRYIYV